MGKSVYGLSRPIVPVVRSEDWPELLRTVVLASGLAAIYGAMHDQVTYSIGPEYFLNFKFHQFAYADLALGDRLFAATVGVLATWWVGLTAGWLLARRCVESRPATVVRPLIHRGLAIVFACGLVGSFSGCAYGFWRGPAADDSVWSGTFEQFGITDRWAFMKVAYIHNADCLGGIAGLFIAYFSVRPPQSGRTGTDTARLA